jgi:hypothetical protein
MWPFSRKQQDPLLVEAYKLGFRTMTDPHRIYAWAVNHNVDLKANKKRLLTDGLLEECVLADLNIDECLKRNDEIDSNKADLWP